MNNDPRKGGSDPTHNPEDERLERALLGKILFDQTLDRLDALKPDDFSDRVNRELFTRMRRLWDAGTELDPVLISDRDPELYAALIDAQGVALEGLGTPASAYARQLRDLGQKRRMIPLLGKAAEMSFNGVPYDEVREYILTEMDTDERRSDRDTWQIRRAADLVEPPAPREWLLDGLLFRGQISMWYGPPGIRKSLLLMDACAAMATGQNWLVRRGFQQDHASLVTFHATKPARVLWLDYDNGEFETEIRVRAALTARQGLESAPFFYMSETIPWLALDNASHVRRVIRLALDVGADVIVIDALGMVLGDVDENAPDVARVIARLKEIRAATGAAIMTIHHPSKAGAQTAAANTYNAAGSAKFSNFFEWTIELRPGEEKETIIASVVKHRGWAKTTKFAAELEYTHFGDDRPDLAHELQTFTFYPAALESAAEKRTQAIHEAVLEALAAGEMNQSQLVEAAMAEFKEATELPIGDKTLRAEIKAMVNKGILNERPTGERRPVFYSLVAPVGSVGSVGYDQ